MCAGVQAAHAIGVRHLDLNPGSVAELLAAFEDTHGAARVRRALAVICGALLVLVLGVVWLSAWQRDQKLLLLAQALDREFHDVTNRQQKYFSDADFEGVTRMVREMLDLDRRNGHALYYRAETTRWLNKENRSGEQYERSHGDLYTYIEEAAHVEAPPGLDRDACYKHSPHGYCRQRTAFIHHSLAVDLQRSGCLTNLATERSEYFKTALDHVAHVEALYGAFNDPSHRPTTKVLRAELEQGTCASVRR